VESVENPLRSLPAVDQLLRLPAVGRWIEAYGRPLTLEALRLVLDDVRAQYPQTGRVPDETALLAGAERRLQEWTTPTLLPVINASGVVLHTNLGRAPLSAAALQPSHWATPIWNMI
jgi:L-seryl-tRNA(Ser) seleniumtransferase